MKPRCWWKAAVCWLVLAAGSAAQEPLRAKVLGVDATARVDVEGLGKLALACVDVPDGASRKALVTRLGGLVGKGVEVVRRGSGPAVLRIPGAAQSINEDVLEDGLAFYRALPDAGQGRLELFAACLKAKAAKRGVWRRANHVRGKPPEQRGATFGLYYKEDRFSYHEQIDRVVAVGADWVQLLVSVFVDKVDSNVIELDPKRTASDARIRETIGYARKKGLRVALLPVVLIRHAGEDDWRGTLRPKDPRGFWRSYDAHLCRYLDIARDTGVDMVSVGSELCSLEKQHDVWPRLIRNARGRYAGWLTYSVNWDHYDVPRFWHLLDQVGMTAYFELTKDKDASLADLVVAWRRVRKEIEAASRRIGRPVVLTELGYASQDGANTAPWNYYLAQDKLDLTEQADCFRAFARVMGDAPVLHGVYVYGFFEPGGRSDTTYAVWGKPAWGVVKGMFADKK